MTEREEGRGRGERRDKTFRVELPKSKHPRKSLQETRQNLQHIPR
jgi:hypothetical protein